MKWKWKKKYYFIKFYSTFKKYPHHGHQGEHNSVFGADVTFRCLNNEWEIRALPLPPHLDSVGRHVSQQLLGLVVRRPVGGEPHVELRGAGPPSLAPPSLSGSAHREHLDVLRRRAQQVGQRARQRGEKTLATGSAAEELLHCHVWGRGGGGRWWWCVHWRSTSWLNLNWRLIGWTNIKQRVELNYLEGVYSHIKFYS